MQCEQCKDLMVEALYGDLDAGTRKRFDEHVDACPECAELLTGLRETLQVMDRRERPDPGEEYWDGYWDRLQARFARFEHEVEEGARPARWWRRAVVAAPAWSWTARVAAAVVILLAGVYLGRNFFPSTNPAPVAPGVSQGVAPADTTPTGGTQVAGEGEAAAQAGPEGPATQPAETPTGATSPPKLAGHRGEAKGAGAIPVEAAAVNDRAMRYIQKSQLLLVALVNTDPDSDDTVAADLPLQRRRSRALVQEASVLENKLNRPDQRRLRELVGELQKILVQIANLESANDEDAVEFIRSRVNEHDVLLKINLEQLRQGTDEDGLRSGAPGATQQSHNPQRSIEL